MLDAPPVPLPSRECAVHTPTYISAPMVLCLLLFGSPSRRRHCVRPLPSASTPKPTRSPPPPTAPGLTGQMLKDALLPPTLRPLRRASSCRQRIRRISGSAAVQDSKAVLCCTQFELILRPRWDRASNDPSIFPRHPPTPTQPEPPTQTTDAKTEYTTSDWPSYRARRRPFPNPPIIRCTPTHPVRGAPHRVGETTLRHYRLAVAEWGTCLISPCAASLHWAPPTSGGCSLIPCASCVGWSAPLAIGTVACLRSLALPMRVLPLLQPCARLLALLLSSDRISFSGAYLPLISPIASHAGSPSVFRRISVLGSSIDYVNLFRGPPVVSIHPFSVLSTRNHPTTLLTTVIHPLSPLSRAGSPS
ncbi:hypothetical protein B0H13DRAFT_2683699 [Mycena leptocephala]|nr:hypothetical protein B0H13DRAFT_2683699 [Mycena leptocephala]